MTDETEQPLGQRFQETRHAYFGHLSERERKEYLAYETKYATMRLSEESRKWVKTLSSQDMKNIERMKLRVTMTVELTGDEEVSEK